MSVFWVVALCSPVEVYWRFRGAFCLHHQGATTQKTAIFVLAAVRTSNLKYHVNLLISKLINHMILCRCVTMVDTLYEYYVGHSTLCVVYFRITTTTLAAKASPAVARGNVPYASSCLSRWGFSQIVACRTLNFAKRTTGFESNTCHAHNRCDMMSSDHTDGYEW
jgi:hypothetical protein